LRDPRRTKTGVSEGGQEDRYSKVRLMKQKAKALPAVLETAKQGREAPLIAGVETEIWTENMLAALENGVKGGKWFSLIDKVYSEQTLRIAWKQVQSNQGSAGIDKQSI